jgi:uncharacterized protein (DUF2164 family)
MKKIEFSKEETRAIVGQLQAYFRDELDQDLGALPGEMLLDFIATTIGRQFYNRGVYDAQQVVAAKAEDISEAILGLERQ